MTPSLKDSLEKRAEELEAKCRGLIKKEDRVNEIYKALKETAEKAEREAIQLSSIQADWRLLSECKDPGHDERWCSTCEAKKDACDEVEQRILKLLDPKTDDFCEIHNLSDRCSKHPGSYHYPIIDKPEE